MQLNVCSGFAFTNTFQNKKANACDGPIFILQKSRTILFVFFKRTDSAQ